MARRELLALNEAVASSGAVKAMQDDIGKWRQRVDALLVEYEEEDGFEDRHWRARMPGMDDRDKLMSQRGAVTHQLAVWERSRAQMVGNMRMMELHESTAPKASALFGEDALTADEERALRERMSLPLIAEEQVRDDRMLASTRTQLAAIETSRKFTASQLSNVHASSLSAIQRALAELDKDARMCALAMGMDPSVLELFFVPVASEPALADDEKPPAAARDAPSARVAKPASESGQVARCSRVFEGAREALASMALALRTTEGDLKVAREVASKARAQLATATAQLRSLTVAKAQPSERAGAAEAAPKCERGSQTLSAAEAQFELSDADATLGLTRELAVATADAAAARAELAATREQLEQQLGEALRRGDTLAFDLDATRDELAAAHEASSQLTRQMHAARATLADEAAALSAQADGVREQQAALTRRAEVAESRCEKARARAEKAEASLAAEREALRAREAAWLDAELALRDEGAQALALVAVERARTDGVAQRLEAETARAQQLDASARAERARADAASASLERLRLEQAEGADARLGAAAANLAEAHERVGALEAELAAERGRSGSAEERIAGERDAIERALAAEHARATAAEAQLADEAARAAQLEVELAAQLADAEAALGALRDRADAAEAQAAAAAADSSTLALAAAEGASAGAAELETALEAAAARLRALDARAFESKATSTASLPGGAVVSRATSPLVAARAASELQAWFESDPTGLGANNTPFVVVDAPTAGPDVDVDVAVRRAEEEAPPPPPPTRSLDDEIDLFGAALDARAREGQLDDAHGARLEALLAGVRAHVDATAESEGVELDGPLEALGVESLARAAAQADADARARADATPPPQPPAAAAPRSVGVALLDTATRQRAHAEQLGLDLRRARAELVALRRQLLGELDAATAACGQLGERLGAREAQREAERARADEERRLEQQRAERDAAADRAAALAELGARLAAAEGALAAALEARAAADAQRDDGGEAHALVEAASGDAEDEAERAQLALADAQAKMEGLTRALAAAEAETEGLTHALVAAQAETETMQQVLMAAQAGSEDLTQALAAAQTGSEDVAQALAAAQTDAANAQLASSSRLLAVAETSTISAERAARDAIEARALAEVHAAELKSAFAAEFERATSLEADVARLEAATAELARLRAADAGRDTRAVATHSLQTQTLPDPGIVLLRAQLLHVRAERDRLSTRDTPTTLAAVAAVERTWLGAGTAETRSSVRQFLELVSPVLPQLSTDDEAFQRLLNPSDRRPRPAANARKPSATPGAWEREQIRAQSDTDASSANGQAVLLQLVNELLLRVAKAVVALQRASLTDRHVNMEVTRAVEEALVPLLPEHEVATALHNALTAEAQTPAHAEIVRICAAQLQHLASDLIASERRVAAMTLNVRSAHERQLELTHARESSRTAHAADVRRVVVAMRATDSGETGGAGGADGATNFLDRQREALVLSLARWEARQTEIETHSRAFWDRHLQSVKAAGADQRGSLVVGHAGSTVAAAGRGSPADARQPASQRAAAGGAHNNGRGGSRGGAATGRGQTRSDLLPSISSSSAPSFAGIARAKKHKHSAEAPSLPQVSGAAASPGPAMATGSGAVTLAPLARFNERS